jgi:hypothetical protein
LFALDSGAQAVAAEEEGFIEGDNDGVVESGTHSAFDDLYEDDCGYYDKDFDWDTTDDTFGLWYGNADEDCGYDDPGDAGLFDM